MILLVPFGYSLWLIYDKYLIRKICLLSIGIHLFEFRVEFATGHILPLLTPLLTAQQLNVQQFAKYMLFVKDILR